ncbi:hypothetical protein BGZ73_002195 [Actinomortierella ambigua]|nr:hypothetical protein BGZ73_002195 [Actinomortierella ambigua]
MDISELRLMVGHRLSGRSLKACAQSALTSNHLDILPYAATAARPGRAVGATGGRHSPSTATMSGTSLPSSLKKLTLPKRYDETDIAPILQRCPKLEYLDLGGLQGVSNSTLQLLLQPDLLSRLVSLAFHRDSEPQAIKQVLRALSRPPWIRHLRITDPTPATLALIAEHHGKHLEHLVLDEVDCSLCSPMTLLTQCSALKTFKFISDNFLPLELRTVVGSPWGCLQLEELDMSATLQHEALVVPLAWQATAMVGQQAGTEAQPRRLVLGDDVGLPPPPPMPLHRKLAEMAFMERLGSLKQLRRLRLRAWPSDYAKSDVMTWELTSGLDQLQHLTRLEVLEIGNRPYRQGVNEILWMRAHWTSLLKLVVYRLEAQQKEWFRIYWPELTVVEGGICDR